MLPWILSVGFSPGLFENPQKRLGVIPTVVLNGDGVPQMQLSSFRLENLVYLLRVFRKLIEL